MTNVDPAIAVRAMEDVNDDNGAVCARVSAYRISVSTQAANFLDEQPSRSHKPG
jgi:hypothetical protein